MEEGYSFIWRANEAPYLETPNGACISLRLERNIPYLDTRDDQTLDAETDDAAVPVAMAEEFEEEQIPNSEHDSDDDEECKTEPIGEEVGDPTVKEEADEDKKVEPKVTSRLREEATSIGHKLTHLPKNPFCDACQRGKMRERYSKRGAFKHNLEKWGGIITFDYLYSGSQRTVGVSAEKEWLVVTDMYTGITHA